MASNPLNGKTILAVDDERDILEIIAEELEEYDVELDRASTFEDAMAKISALSPFRYDLAILDIMGVRGFELLEFAVSRKTPVIILTAHDLSPESLKKSIELGARAYLPKDQLGKIAPFIEDVLTLSYNSAWRSLFKKLGPSFSKRFGPDWRKTEKEFWEKFDDNLGLNESMIIES